MHQDDHKCTCIAIHSSVTSLTSMVSCLFFLEIMWPTEFMWAYKVGLCCSAFQPRVYVNCCFKFLCNGLNCSRSQLFAVAGGFGAAKVQISIFFFPTMMPMIQICSSWTLGCLVTLFIVKIPLKFVHSLVTVGSWFLFRIFTCLPLNL